MPQDGLIEGIENFDYYPMKIFAHKMISETSKLTIDDGNERNDDAVANALDRIREEAQQVRSFGIRGVRDITADFSRASTQLVPGQLVKDESFTLFEAVGALEVGRNTLPSSQTRHSKQNHCTCIIGSQI